MTGHPDEASAVGAVQRNARLLDRFGHTPQFEVPDDVIGTIRDWLGQHFTS
jgi:hypothetical protein